MRQTGALHVKIKHPHQILPGIGRHHYASGSAREDRGRDLGNEASRERSFCQLCAGNIVDDVIAIIDFLQSADCRLQSAVCSLQSAVCSLQSAVCSLQSANVRHRDREKTKAVPMMSLKAKMYLN